MLGGGGLKVPPISICENNRKSNKIMHCVDFLLSGGCEDIMGIIHEFIYRSVKGT